MKKLRVFQKVNQKRTAPIHSLRGIGTVLLLTLFMPYMVSALWGNIEQVQETSAHTIRLQTGTLTVINETALGREKIPLEIYVADKLSRCMTEQTEKEALKAQAVLIRTNLIKEEGNDIYVEDSGYGKSDLAEIYQIAVAETKGMILEYDGKPIYGAHFESSAGSSRNAAESLMYREYPYLSGVPCGKDYMSEGCYSSVVYSKEKFSRLWQQVEKLSPDKQKQMTDGGITNDGKVMTTGDKVFSYIRDNAGYVTALRYRGEWAEGEEVRYTFLLNSSNFSIVEEENSFIIEVTGKGHGFGMSRFSANEMAKEGKDFLTILQFFFKEAELTKIDR